MAGRRAFLLLLVAGLAGCSSPPATASAPVTPREALVASGAGVDAGNYRFELTNTGGAKAVGSVHLPSRSGEMTTSGMMSAKVESRVVDGRSYTNTTTMTGVSLGWQSAEGPQFDTDVVGLKPLLAAVTTAEGTAPTIRGTVDVTQVQNSTKVFGADVLRDLPPAAGKAVPYAATLDGSGMLTRLALDMPTIGLRPAGEWTFQFTYGDAQPVTAP